MDDESKQYLMYGLLAGGWVFIIYMAVFGGLIWGVFGPLDVLISLVLAGGVAAGVFFGMKKMSG